MLFSTINFESDRRRSSDTHDYVDIARLAPFVNTIHFLVPTENWTLELDRFKDIIIAQSIRRFPPGNAVGKFADFMNPQWSGNPPFPPSVLEDFYSQYESNFPSLLHNHNVVRVWTKVLRSLPHVTSVRFKNSSWTYDRAYHLRQTALWCLQPLLGCMQPTRRTIRRCGFCGRSNELERSWDYDPGVEIRL